MEEPEICVLMGILNFLQHGINKSNHHHSQQQNRSVRIKNEEYEVVGINVVLDCVHRPRIHKTWISLRFGD
jgi:hypothetical protein